MASNIGNIRIEPVTVNWEIEEQWQVTCVADVAGSLQSSSFKFYNGSNAGFYVWLNLGGAGVDPAHAGFTAIPVAAALNASASTLATAIAAAVDGNASFVASSDGANILITNAAAGECDDMLDVDTGFTFVQCQQGGAVDFGYTDGNIEVTFEETLLEVMAHQTGTNLLAELRQGAVSEVTLTLKETDAENLKEVFAKAAGGVYTPSGGTELFGWGNSRQGLSTFTQARRLVLHPVALSTSDKTRDLCFWKAYPMPETLVFSGEDVQTLSLTFKTYLDDQKPDEVSRWAYGDWSQLVPVVP